MLDRIDSLIFLAPFAYALFTLLWCHNRLSQWGRFFLCSLGTFLFSQTIIS
jgi:hypothetical protein